MLVQINQTTPSKASLDGYVKDIIEYAESNEGNPIEISAKLDFMMKICDIAKKEIKPAVIKELEKAKERKDYFGYKVEVKETGTKYDYSNCGDAKWYDLQEQLEKLKVKISDRETFLKAIKEPIMVADEETGEMFKVMPPVKTSTTSPCFTLQ